MAPVYCINKPDVLAKLPSRLGSCSSLFHAGEAFTQQLGSKKRKRLEVAIGVDGEAVNIYHIPSSTLRTSYPIPPHESFTCPPYSIRYQEPSTGGSYQHTYFATKDPAGFKITLCKDVADGTGKTSLTTTSERLRYGSPVTHLFSSCRSQEPGSEHSGQVEAESKKVAQEYNDLLVVCKDGQVSCLDGVTLRERWSVPSYRLCKDLLPPSSSSGFEVGFVFQASAVDFLAGLFGGRQDAFGGFGQPIEAGSFNPDVLALIANTRGPNGVQRHLILLGALTGASTLAPSQQSLIQLQVVPLPTHEGLDGDAAPSFQLQLRSGRLLELCDGMMRTYDLRTAVPRVCDAAVMSEAASSFVQLSEHSVLSLSPDSLTVTNITYRSVQAQAACAMGAETSTSVVDRGQARLITYFSKLDLAIAITNDKLYSVQVARQKSTSKEGLLIDAIGRGFSKADHLPLELPRSKSSKTFSRFVPGTLSDSYVKQALADVEALDECLTTDNLKEFEKQLAIKFGVAVADGPSSKPSNGAIQENTGALADWRWLDRSKGYPAVDRRWVLYAISRVFTLELGITEMDRPALACILPDTNVLAYLIVAGHLTLSNILAAFKSELSDTTISKNRLAEELIQQLIDADPSLELLMSYASATRLGEVELLLIVRTVVRSLDQQPRLGVPTPNPNGTHEDEYVAMEIDKLERQLELAEYSLGDDSNVRARLLTAALEGLAGYASAATVRALRFALTPSDILSLIHLLRIQLVGSAWTMRYFDITSLDQDDGPKGIPDGAIALIAELLARCIDAIGTNGWLSSGMGNQQPGSAQFLAALKLEVNAALEGVNETVYLSGLLGETVRFGTTSLAGQPRKSLTQGGDRPRAIVSAATSQQLPLGLASKQAPVSQYKVISGGEVVERSAREIGHLISRQVKEYTLERIPV